MTTICNFCKVDFVTKEALAEHDCPEFEVPDSETETETETDYSSSEEEDQGTDSAYCTETSV